jgi:hypothetical protein
VGTPLGVATVRFGRGAACCLCPLSSAACGEVEETLLRRCRQSTRLGVQTAEFLRLVAQGTWWVPCRAVPCHVIRIRQQEDGL